ncbi:hypothetical protein [Streptomyces sp. NPDC005181]
MLGAQGLLGGPEPGQGGWFAVHHGVDHRLGNQVQALGEQPAGF